MSEGREVKSKVRTSKNEVCGWDEEPTKEV